MNENNQINRINEAKCRPCMESRYFNKEDCKKCDINKKLINLKKRVDKKR